VIFYSVQAADYLTADSLDGDTENTGPEIPIPNDDEKKLSNINSLYLSADEIGSSQIEKQRDIYLQNKGWDLGVSNRNPGSAYIGWGEADIQADPQDIKYGQSRVLSFYRAYAEAVGAYIRSRERETTTTTVRTFFQDDVLTEGDLATETSRFEAIHKKTVALAEASLDSLLTKLDIDPATISKMNMENKQRLAEDSIRKEVRVEALQSVSGMRVISTFSDLSKIGVLVVQSNKLQKIAQGIVDGRIIPGMPDTGDRPSIAEQINASFQDNRTLISQFGVRVLTDENGDSAVVSFGQWSPSVTRNDSKMKQRIAVKSAKIQAKNVADGDITDFVNSTAILNDRSMIAESAVVNRRITSASELEEESFAIGSLTDKMIKQQGKAKIRGVTSIKTWAANHPETGHLIVGRVLMWSPTSQMKMTAGVAEEKKAPESQPMENKIRTSVDLENAHSF